MLNKTMNLAVQDLIPCCLCSMFWKASKSEAEYFRALSKNDMVCRNCHEKTAMQKHIDHLNTKISELNYSINRLNQIRGLEDDIDDLSNRFGNCNINPGENEIGLQEVVVIANNHSSNVNSVSNFLNGGMTSVWSETSDSLSSISRVHHEDFPLDLSSKHTSLIVDSSSNSGSVIIMNDEQSSISHCDEVDYRESHCPVTNMILNFINDGSTSVAKLWLTTNISR